MVATANLTPWIRRRRYRRLNQSPQWIASHAFEFDGTSDWISIGDRAEFAGATRFTVAAWIRPDPAATNAMIIGQNDAANQRAWHLIKVSTDTIRFQVSSVLTSDGAFVESAAVAEGTWTHVVGVFDGSAPSGPGGGRFRLYTNTVEASTHSGNPPASVLDASSAFTIGSDVNGTRDFDGRIHSPAVWIGLAASVGQVAELYNGGSPHLDLTTTTLGTPTFWYPGADGAGNPDTLPTIVNRGSASAANGTAAGNTTIVASVP